jgi:hypothetical protein
MAKRVVLIVLGVVAALCGIGGTLLGIGITVLSGRNLESGFHALGTQTPALVSKTEQVTNSSPGGTSVGNVDIILSARSSSPVFLGIGPAAQVDAFLANVPFDEVTDLRISPYRVNTIRHPGSQPAGPPTDESFWTVSATGTSPTLDWRVTDGDFRAVIMNLDGSPGVALQTQFAIKISGIAGIGVGALVLGLLFVVGGIVLIILGVRSRPTPPAAGEPSYPYPPTYGGPPPPSYGGPPQPPGGGPTYGGGPPYGGTPYGGHEPPATPGEAAP